MYMARVYKKEKIIDKIRDVANKENIDLSQDYFLEDWRKQWTDAYNSNDLKQLEAAKDLLFKLVKEKPKIKVQEYTTHG
tara:strand:+ start:226 stop:462 length:237 start_codon:yes stop_codon:yes gene_type:complete